MDKTADKLSRILNVPPDQILGRVKQLLIECARLEAKGPQIRGLLAEAMDVYGVKLILQKLQGVSIKQLRPVVDELCRRDTMCVMLVTESCNRTQIITGVSPDLVDKGFSASAWVADVSEIVGGSGGGSDRVAQGGGLQTGKVKTLFARAYSLIRTMVKECD